LSTARFIIRAVKGLHRIVVFMLLLALPFHAAICAAGVHCDASTHDSPMTIGAVTLHDHSGDPHAGHAVHVAGQVGDHGDTAFDLQGDGKCSACSSCCLAAAIIPAAWAPPATRVASIKIRSNVDRTVVSAVRDDLFRPPRTTAL
jgi:hypothetical protein